MRNCHPEKTNVDRGEDIGFLGVTITHVTLWCSQYLYNVFVLSRQSVLIICVSLNALVILCFFHKHVAILM